MSVLPTPLFLSLLAALVACSGDKSDSGSEGASSSATRVTVGAYGSEDGNLVDLDADLTYTIGESCQIWSRTAQEHGDPPPAGHEGTHDHWNAADASTYVNGVFTWVEYGPFLTEADVATSCTTGSSPSDPKSVTADEYKEFQPGLYLRIKSVE